MPWEVRVHETRTEMSKFLHNTIFKNQILTCTLYTQYIHTFYFPKKGKKKKTIRKWTRPLSFTAQLRKLSQ